MGIASMNPAFSLYLDIVRFAAACLVYLTHSNQRWLVSDVVPASVFAHSAVVVFFVLSGFVIAYVTATKDRDWIAYTSSRLSRIYSVALPALLLTLVLDAIGRQLLSSVYHFPFDYFAVRLLASAFMLNEWWFVSITTFSNAPYWSITFGLWSCAAFGLLTFVRGRAEWAWGLGLLLVMGPKIILLAPLWWLGVYLYHSPTFRGLSVASAWLLFLLSFISIILFQAFELSTYFSEMLRGYVGGALHRELTFSNFFLGDYILSPLVFLNFAGARRLLQSASATPMILARLIWWTASSTFILYLVHQPVLTFWGAVLRGDPSGWNYWVVTTLLTAVTVVLISLATEAQRFRMRNSFSGALTTASVWLRRGRGKHAF